MGNAIETIEPDHAVLSMPFKPELVTMGDVVHGGAISTLIDTAATVAAWATDEVAGDAGRLDGLARGQLRGGGARRGPEGGRTRDQARAAPSQHRGARDGPRRKLVAHAIATYQLS